MRKSNVTLEVENMQRNKINIRNSNICQYMTDMISVISMSSNPNKLFCLVPIITLINPLLFLSISLFPKHSKALISRPPRPLQKAKMVRDGSLPPTDSLNHNTSHSLSLSLINP